MSAQIEEAYAQGWNAASNRMAARVLVAMAEMGGPVPGEGRVNCQLCQQPMEIGQPATIGGWDVFGNKLWEHRECPVIVEQLEDQEDENRMEEQAAAEPLAMRKFQLVTDVVNLPRAAVDQEEGEDGEEVCCWPSNPCTECGQPTEVPEPTLPEPTFLERLGFGNEEDTGQVVVDRDSGAPYTAPLPQRVPGATFPQVKTLQELGLRQAPDLQLLGRGPEQGVTTYLITNAVCGGCSGPLNMTTKHDPSGTWLITKTTVCQGCGSVVDL